MKPYQAYLYFLTLFIFFGIASSIAVAQDATVKDESKTEKPAEELALEGRTLLDEIINLLW